MTEPLWRPTAPLATLRARAELLERIRRFFREAGVLEVETPACSFRGNTDPAIESLTTDYTGPGHASGARLYLHTSPEFPMKRLLAAGSGPIYQICRVYRNGELGRLHNPEFSLLEWYRPGFDHHRLMDEVTALVRAVAGADLPQRRLSYAELFSEYLGLEPHGADPPRLRARALELKVPGAADLDLPGRDAWLDLLLTHCIEPRLPPRQMTFVYDYPASQAALARVRPGDPPLAERFELYLGGMELANGFHELADAAEQRTRFEAELEERSARGQTAVPMDVHLLAALEAGLPECAGVALGLDRLLLWLTGAERIERVLAFGFERA
jgi:lysyl-tRNA synthetase class 2